MTEALITTTGANPDVNPSLRVLPSEIGSVIPVVDIADSLGYGRSSISNIIKKNEGLFKGFTTFKALQTSGGTQQFLCLNSTGADRLLLLLKPSKNRQELCERVEWFRAKAFGQLAAVKGIVPVQEPGIIPELKQAKEEAEVCGCKPEVLLAAVYRKHGETEKANALVPAAVHGEPGWYNPSGLVELCNDPNLTPERLNQYLANYRENGEWKPFQYREGKIWRLTKRGFEHGREYPFNLGNGHSEPRISWRESVLYAAGLKRPIAEGQAALPAHAGAS